MRYSKPALSIADQVTRLQERGLEIEDASMAAFYLRHINYYRLGAYLLPFEVPPEDGFERSHAFKEGATFEKALSLYLFDRSLRLLLMDLIERFEVSVRAHWAHYFAMTYGPHAYIEAGHYRDGAKHNGCIETLSKEINSSTEASIKHYLGKYDEPLLPPVWVSCEVMTFGHLSHWIANMKQPSDRQAIASAFGLDESIFCRFLHLLSHFRNLCAHHSRVWNRRLTFEIKIPRRPAELSRRFVTTPEDKKKRIYNVLVMLDHLTAVLSPESEWHKELDRLMSKHPEASPAAMGFPDDWRDRDPWKTRLMPQPI